MSDSAAFEPITLLLVALHEEAPRAVNDALREWGSIVKVIWVEDPTQALARAQEMSPHVVLVDDELDGTDAVALIRQLADELPSAAVLAVVDEHSTTDVRRAMLAGARSFITKPLDAGELVATLREVRALRAPASPASETSSSAVRLGHVVVFCGPKGGTGRTTMMANTSVALHQHTGQSVVLLDADFSAPALDVSLNLRDERDLSDLLSRLNRLDDDVLERVLAHHGSGVHVLLAPPPTAADHEVTPQQIQEILTHLRRRYDWVMVDLGLPLDAMALAVLDAADRILVSVLPEMVGLRNARLLLEQFQERKYDAEKIWLVLNRATLRGGVGRQDIEKRLRIRVRHTIPDDQPLASLSVNRGVPLVLSHPRSAVARALQDLARHINSELSPGTPVRAADGARTQARPHGAIRRMLAALTSRRRE